MFVEKYELSLAIVNKTSIDFGIFVIIYLHEMNRQNWVIFILISIFLISTGFLLGSFFVSNPTSSNSKAAFSTFDVSLNNPTIVPTVDLVSSPTATLSVTLSPTLTATISATIALSPTQTSSPAATLKPLPLTPPITAVPPRGRGDVDRNGRVDLVDVTIFIRELVGEAKTITADLDGNGKVELRDFEEIRTMLRLGTLYPTAVPSPTPNKGPCDTKGERECLLDTNCRAIYVADKVNPNKDVFSRCVLRPQ